MQIRSPKNDNHTLLEEYKEAARLGEEQGDCWSFYPECPLSVFNVIPDVYTEKDRFNITFDEFGGGADLSKDDLKINEIKVDVDLTPK